MIFWDGDSPAVKRITHSYNQETLSRKMHPMVQIHPVIVLIPPSLPPSLSLSLSEFSLCSPTENGIDTIQVEKLSR